MRGAARALLLPLALAASTPGLAQESAADALSGGWCAELRYGGQTARAALHVPSDGELPVTADLPTMDAWGVPIGKLEVAGTAVRIGPWALTWDPEGGTVSGDLPAWLVPGQSIPAVFERCDPPARPEVEWSFPAPEIAWSVQTDGAVWAGLALDRSAGRLVVAAATGTVVAYEAASGEEVWRWTAGGAVRARPSVIGDAVYVVSDDGKVSRLSRLTGELGWQAEIGSGPDRLGPQSPDSKWDRYGSSVIAAGNRLFVGSRDGALYALDPESGRRLWRFQTEDIVQATPAASGGRVFVASFDGGVTALDAASGEPLWRHGTGFAIPADLAVADGVVLAGSRSYELVALKVGNGDPAWKRYFWFSWIDSPPHVVDGVIYVGSSDGLVLSALSTENGEPFWQSRVPGWSWAQPAVSGNRVFTGTVGSTSYVGSRTGSFLAADRASGEIRWLFLPPPPEEGDWGFAASPAAADDLVYAADLGGRVYAFRTAAAE